MTALVRDSQPGRVRRSHELSMPQSVVEHWPAQHENHLRLAEGYLALGDPEPARPHLCLGAGRCAELRQDHQRLLDELFEQAEVAGCP